jgi:hypothetical protein
VVHELLPEHLVLGLVEQQVLAQMLSAAAAAVVVVDVVDVVQEGLQVLLV